MLYVLFTLIGTILAAAGGLWYYVRRVGSEATSNQALKAEADVQASRIKTLDDRIVDSEYARRAQEKRRDAETTKSDNAGVASKLLAGAGHDDEVN